jgi:3-hydroxyacyl-CoA dehydrogenase/enoyl-CoA hydratase/3-hydroxybutyryl-CoA epimerase
MAETPRKHFSLAVRPDGVAVLTFDSPGSPVNILSREVLLEVEELFSEVERDPAIRAVVLASGKKDSFVAGADLDQVLAMETAEEGAAFSRNGHRILDRIEASRKPVVAAIHGAALGGGLEVALACRYLIASDHPKTVLALPEVMLGLLPGGGGTERLPRRVGLPAALPMLLAGRRLRARQALKAGLVDAVTSPGGIAETAAKAALALAEGRLRPRERRKSLVDRLVALPPARTMLLKKARAEVLRKTRGLYPAPLSILEAVGSGLAGSRAAGQEAESVLFGKLVADPGSKNLIRLFDAMSALKKAPHGTAKESAEPPKTVRRLAVLGAGLMGEGIASVSLSLVPVVLKDVAETSLGRAAASIHRSLGKRVRSGALTRLDRDRQWFGLTLATDPSLLGNADLVIEAVFEDLALKRRVLAETEGLIAADAVFASNTSALPIAAIAAEARHPERVVGMHYFSPVPKMPLLEVVVAAKTAPRAVETARAFGVAQGKTVIVVKDAPGFYTTRILAPLMNEAILLLDEGADVRALDTALCDFGFPVGPANLLDEVGIDVAAHVSDDLGQAFGSRGLSPSPTLAKLAGAGWHGRKNGKGFYRYGGPSKQKEVDEGVYAFFGGPARKSFDPREMADRLALLMLNEAVWCLDEGVLASARDGDVGAILGLGFPPLRGGPFRYADALGAQAVVDRMKELGDRLGPRFTPAPLLVRMAAHGERFHPG